MTATRATEHLPALPPRRTAAAPPAFAGAATDAADGAAPWAARAIYTLQLALAAVFLVAGAATLGGLAEVVAPFGTIENVTGFGAWLPAATGSLEVLGGLLLCGRASAGVGAVLLGAVMTGAALTHVLVLGDAPSGPAVLLAGLAVVAYAHRFTLRVVAAVLERNL